MESTTTDKVKETSKIEIDVDDVMFSRTTIQDILHAGQTLGDIVNNITSEAQRKIEILIADNLNREQCINLYYDCSTGHPANTKGEIDLLFSKAREYKHPLALYEQAKLN